MPMQENGDRHVAELSTTDSLAFMEMIDYRGYNAYRLRGPARQLYKLICLSQFLVKTASSQSPFSASNISDS